MTLDLDKAPQAGSSATRSVPVIDIEALVAGQFDPAGDAVGRIAKACAEWGFFQVINHGIDPELVDATVSSMRDFFAQASDVKERLIRDRGNPWGYYHNELTKNQRDRKEVFDFTVDGVDPIYNAENRWPEADGNFRNTMCRYRDACAELSKTLLRGLCAGLGLSPDALDAAIEPQHTGFVRLNYYPVRDPLEGRLNEAHTAAADMGVHHHTDAGLLTVLLQDDVGGLQVYNNGYWHDVEPRPGALVINTADMLQVWSNDRYRAALHRVLAMTCQDRYSIPFFYNPAATATVAPIESLLQSGEQAHYRPIAWSDFRYRRTDGDYADYGDEVQIAQYRIDA